MILKTCKSLDFFNIIQKCIYNKKIIEPYQTILITFSGGQDSICLLFFIIILKKQWSWNIQFVWCNHLWQMPSFGGFNHTLKIIFALQVETSFSLPIQRIFNERDARNWRLRVFYRIALFYNRQIIFTGHTSTDRIETLLLNLFRGCGVDGLQSLHWSRKFILKKYKNQFYLKPLQNRVPTLIKQCLAQSL
uniref:hypothetical protein n=1 Tax=Symbiochloris sp. SG-2018 TaxID=2126034 RepID=UPI002115C42B|nr:hypothetical protein NRL16_pgp082 [Symbiochloris sp. SG-2018]UTQ75688.1 hypothetical protein [Symbiochloris sp. SG-2018]